MAQPTPQQLAELLIGIARAQAAVVNGLESEFAGIRSGRVVPSLQNAAHLRDHPDPTLVDLPVRVLLASFGRAGPDPAAITRELERLFSGVASAPAAAPAPAAPASAESKPDFASTTTLDFSDPAKPA